jgi:hypothetical protein
MPGTVEDHLVELAKVTSMDEASWADFLAMSADDQKLAALNYIDADWVKAPDTFGTVMAILGVLGTVAGVVSGVGGAVGAISALKAVL